MPESLVNTFPVLGSSPSQFAEAIGLLVAFTLVGFVIDSILYKIVKSRSESHHSSTGVGLAHGLHGLPTSVGAILGINVGLRHLDLPPDGMELLSTVTEVLAIIVITAFSARIAVRLIRAYTERDDARLPSSSIFVNLARVIIWIVGGISILAALGISITPLIAALGVGGLAVGLALQSTLENVFSGIQVLASKQIEPDDFIQLETGEQGWVQDVTWRNTTIKLLSNDLIIVPNSTIGKSRIVNYTSTDEQHVVWTDLGVAYDSDLDLVERVTLEVATEMQGEPGAVPDYEPIFRFKEFGESSIHLTVSIKATTVADRWPLRHTFIKRLHARYAAEGITIPFPQRTVHMAAPAEATQAE